MGAWGYEPWANDDAADWFNGFFDNLKMEMLREAFQDIDHDEGSRFRAACFVLQCLGRVYVWPTEHMDELKSMLERAIHQLTEMIEPASGESEFLLLYDEDPEAIASVRRQIDELKARRAGIA